MKAINLDEVLNILHKYGKYIFVTDDKKYSDMVDEIANLKALKQEPFINKSCVSSEVCEHDKNKVLDEIKAEILDCLKALDEIEKFNIYLPNETTARRLTYQQCLEFIDKYKAESGDKDG